MFKPVRVVASIIFLASIGLVFVAAFVLRNEVRVVCYFCSPMINGVNADSLPGFVPCRFPSFAVN